MTNLYARCLLIAVAFVNVIGLRAARAAESAELTDQEAKVFLNDKGCNACHEISESRLGPPFAVVSERYAGDNQAKERLTEKILHGGAGSWGVVPMISNPKLSEAQARTIAVWILKIHAEKPR